MIPASHFFRNLLRLNRLSTEYTGWQLLPGMRFKDTLAWWREGSRRNPHEGLDLLYLTDRSGQRRELPEQALVPPLWNGEVVTVCEDFLGSTVVVRHPVRDGQGWSLISLYGHVLPLISCGEEISAGEPLATVAGGKVRGTSAPPDHLHLSLGWLAPGWSPTKISWPGLWSSPGIRLVDPLAPWPLPLVQPKP